MYFTTTDSSINNNRCALYNTCSLQSLSHLPATRTLTHHNTCSLQPYTHKQPAFYPIITLTVYNHNAVHQQRELRHIQPQPPTNNIKISHYNSRSLQPTNQPTTIPTTTPARYTHLLLTTDSSNHLSLGSRLNKKQTATSNHFRFC